MNILYAIIRLIIRIFHAIKRNSRYVYFKLSLSYLGKKTVFGSGIVVQGYEFIKIGSNCSINDHVVLQSGPGSILSIGNHVTVSFGAKIMTGQYELSSTGHNREKHIYKSVIIEDGVWIGSNAVILPGIHIGNNSIVGAGAVITHNVPPKVIAGGVPAKVIKNLI
jgi:acetyltransferase-like isoleucine patch superfamily enzyme